MSVQYFNEFLLEKINLKGQNLKELYSKHNSKLPYAMFKRFISKDPLTEIAEDDTLMSAGEYTIWFIFNQNVAVTNLPANLSGGEGEDSLSYASKFVDYVIWYSHFKRAAAADPTTLFKEVNGQEVVSKMGVYTKWLLMQWSKATGGARSRFAEDLEPVEQAFNILIKHKNDLAPTASVKNPKDINSFKNVDVLKGFVKEFVAETEHESQSKIMSETTVIYDDVYHGQHEENMHHLTVVIPHTHESSRYWGDNTEWCTAYESPMNYNNYTKQGELFIIIFKNADLEDKYQFHFESKQFMDSEDRPINLSKFLQDYKEVTNILLHYWQQNIDKKPAYFNNITVCDKTGVVTLKLLEENKNIDISKLGEEAVARIMAMPKADKSALEGYRSTEGLLVKDGQLHIVYIDWNDDDIIELFDDDCRDAAKELLNGEYYASDSIEYQDASRIWGDVNSENQTNIIGRLSSLEMEYDGEEVVVDTIDDYNVTDILEMSEASDILDAMQRAYNGSESSAYEAALHNKFTDELEGLLGKFVYLSGEDLLFKTKHLGYSNNKPRTMDLTHNLAFKINPSKLIGFYDTVADMEDEWDGSLYSLIKMSLAEDNDLLSVRTDYVNYDIDSKSFNEDLEQQLEELGEFIPKYEKDEVEEDDEDDSEDDEDEDDYSDEDEEIYTESFRNIKSFDKFK